jgi:hypothetical protein
MKQQPRLIALGRSLFASYDRLSTPRALHMLRGLKILKLATGIGWLGAPGEHKLGKSPQNEPPEGLTVSIIIGYRSIFSRNCWNYHLTFPEKLTTIIKSEIYRNFQTSLNVAIILKYYKTLADLLIMVKLYIYRSQPC